MAIGLVAVLTMPATVAVTQAARPVSGPASRPAVTTLVDYPKVFDAMRRTMDERGRLELERIKTTQQVSERTKQLGDLRRKVAATTEPAARAKLEAELRLASDEDDEIHRGQQAAIEQLQAKTMLELFREIESAIQKAAAEQGVTLAPFPPYPPNIDRMNGGQLRQYLVTKRFMPRPAGVPDLTEPVIKLLNQPSTRPTSAPSTRQSVP
ncbi:MAG: hypothetical protein QOF78_3484 [Phycisphaerales bacterium]|nr:hypothetical protein [Phycisphaerales bacterium]